MRCADGRVAVRAEIAVPEIVRDDQDDVGRRLPSGRDAVRDEAQEGDERSTSREVAVMHGAIMPVRAPEVDVVRVDVSRRISGRGCCRTCRETYRTIRQLLCDVPAVGGP